jgi:hypothetical protein
VEKNTDFFRQEQHFRAMRLRNSARCIPFACFNRLVARQMLLDGENRF